MNILFVCTHNRCRSILSEALANHRNDPRLKAASAGSQPVGEVHPLSLKYLKETGVKVDGLTSKSWDDLQSFALDVVITVCDSAAGEACPVWFGQTIKMHWGLSDPSKIEGGEQEIKRAFYECIAIINKRLDAILNLDLQKLKGDELKSALQQLGAK